MTFSPRAIEAAWKAYQDTPIDLLADSDEETKRCVVNALTAALAVDGVALQGWQDISTAPHDGTRILLWASAWHDPCSGSWYGSDWRQVYDLPTFAHSPTHWMPLPPTPAASDREERR